MKIRSTKLSLISLLSIPVLIYINISLSHAEDPAPNGLSAAFQVHRIQFLKDRGYTGRGQMIGVLDQFGTESPDLIHPKIKNHLTSKSKNPHHPDNSHGTSIVSIISSDSLSIAPEVQVHYDYGDENLIGSKNENNSVLPTLSRLPDFRTSRHALRSLIKKEIRVINLARTLPITPETRIQPLIQTLSEKDGLVFKALGNHHYIWNFTDLNGTKILDKPSSNWNSFQKFFAIDATFYRWLYEYRNHAKAFIFLVNLNTDGKTINSQSNLPGNLFSERTLSVIGTQFPSVKDQEQDPDSYSAGTSNSTAVATGTFALLKQAYPDCSNQKLGQAMLDSASYEGLEINNKGQSIPAQNLTESQRLMIFGKGKLDAEATFRRAKEVCL